MNNNSVTLEKDELSRRSMSLNTRLFVGRIAMEGNGAYSMSKHALVAYSDTLRQEMRKWGVTVSIIEPTGFYTGDLVIFKPFSFHPAGKKTCKTTTA